MNVIKEKHIHISIFISGPNIKLDIRQNMCWEARSSCCTDNGKCKTKDKLVVNLPFAA